MTSPFSLVVNEVSDIFDEIPLYVMIEPSSFGNFIIRNPGMVSSRVPVNQQFTCVSAILVQFNVSSYLFVQFPTNIVMLNSKRYEVQSIKSFGAP